MTSSKKGLVHFDEISLTQTTHLPVELSVLGLRAYHFCDSRFAVTGWRQFDWQNIAVTDYCYYDMLAD